MKVAILKLTAILLILAGNFMSCKKTVLMENVWECTPEPNVMITLTFDSLQSKAFVNTDPQDLGYPVSSPTNNRYLFEDGLQYVVNRDSMYLIVKEEEDSILMPFFLKTMLSPNCMKLQSLPGFSTHEVPSVVRVYLFNRKIKQS